jgi:thymidine phosphorylase
MEVLAPVDLDLAAMRKVVEREGGCVVWGGSASLSPADDLLIRVEKVLDLDSEGQLIASILSKKLAAGSTHVVIDMPVGPTAKLRSPEAAAALSGAMRAVAAEIGLGLEILLTDGMAPVGRGIGPALEARDVMSVLRGEPDAPADLRARALDIAGKVLEFSPGIAPGTGRALAESLLDSGAALAKFDAIREAQGGARDIPVARHRRPVQAPRGGVVAGIDNRLIARLAKFAGAPADKTAGLDLHVRPGEMVEAGQDLFTLHADSPGELDYALAWLSRHPGVVTVAEAAA